MTTPRERMTETGEIMKLKDQFGKAGSRVLLDVQIGSGREMDIGELTMLFDDGTQTEGHLRHEARQVRADEARNLLR